MKFAPHDYQAYAIDYIETHPVAAVLLDMGLGKTVISLTAIADLLFDSFVAHQLPEAAVLFCCKTLMASGRTVFPSRRLEARKPT